MIIPLVAAAVGIGADILKDRAQGKAEKEQQRLYNNWLKAREAGVQNITAELLERGVDVYGPQTTTSSQYGTSTSATSGREKAQRRAYTPEELRGMESATRQLIEGRLGAPSAVSEGEKLRAISGIQRANLGARQAASNIAAARGFGGAQTYAGAAPIETAASSQIADYLSSIPNLERARRTEDIGLSEAFQAARRGEDTSRQYSGTTTGQSAGGSTMTAPPNLSELASFLLPPGPQQGPSAYSPVGSGAGALSKGLLAYYASRQKPDQSPMTMPGYDVLSWGMPGGAGYKYPG